MGRDVNVDYINPFIEAAIVTIRKLAQVEVTRESIFLKGEGNEVYGVSGIITLGGGVSGAIVLSFPEMMAIRLVNKIIGEDNDTINANIVDGVCELANIITGNAKSALIQKGYQFEIGLPRVVTGRSYFTVQSKASTCVVVSFTSELGRLCLEVSMRKIRRAT